MSDKETFEAALHSLEEAVEKLESGDLNLEDALATFQKGVEGATRCRKHLKSVENKVEQLMKDRQGEYRLEPLDIETP